MDRQPFWEVSNRRDYLDSCRFRYSVYLLYYCHSVYLLYYVLGGVESSRLSGFLQMQVFSLLGLLLQRYLTDAGIQFTWFTTTKLQILTREELGGRLEALKKEMQGASVC